MGAIDGLKDALGRAVCEKRASECNLESVNATLNSIREVQTADMEEGR